MNAKSNLFIVLLFTASLTIQAQNRWRNANNRPNNYSTYSTSQVKIPNIPYLSAKQQHKIENICIDQQKKLNKLNADRSMILIQLQQVQRSPYTKPEYSHDLRKKLHKIEENIIKVNYKAEQKINGVLDRNQQIAYMSQKDIKPHRGKR